MAQVVWSEAALSDLHEVLAYAAEQQLDFVALSQRLLDKSDLLVDQPQLGWKIPEFDRDDIREVFVHPYRLIYQVDENPCTVVAVVHASRNLLGSDFLKRFDA